MAFPRIGGVGIGLNLNNALGSAQQFGAQVLASGGFTQSAGSNAVTLQAGNLLLIPAGTYVISPGPYTSLQWLDPVTTQWRTANASATQHNFFIDSDGGNWRLANLTGLPLGAFITSGGTGNTNGIGSTATGLTITPSAGGSIWVPVVGGALSNSSATITGGSTYSFPPILVVGPPPAGGVQATATATLSAGAISAITFTNPGAGYTVVPNITVLNDIRDTTGSGGAIVLSSSSGIAQSGVMTAMYPSPAFNASYVASTGGYGVPVTAAPTFTFAPTTGSPAATAIMNFCVTAFTVSTAGSGYTPASAQSAALAVAMGGTSGALTRATGIAGPIADIGLVSPRPAFSLLTTSGGTIVTTTQQLVDSGYGFQAAPAVCVIGSTGTGAAATAAVGGVTDTSYVQPL